MVVTCFLSAGSWFHSAAKTLVISANSILGFSARNCSRLSFKNRMYPVINRLRIFRLDASRRRTNGLIVFYAPEWGGLGAVLSRIHFFRFLPLGSFLSAHFLDIPFSENSPPWPVTVLRISFDTAPIRRQNCGHHE